ncbi:MAG: asparagine synthase (glutamine-hydrolyzing) [Bacteroidetes bacterium HGW-Bacteroidetes-4]|jgi:asparagine synthase (glutamine-hydrolysing)|nr:MAG: asparagine synthase (glutamine-hydrolyzing) [Bacteroidetes bacterium HGW-Bacteroidetes-4]
MCGIVGFYSRKQVFTKHELELMTDTLVHRGPDARGTYSRNHLGLGHRRLSIIDLSEQANQPMVSQSGNSWIVFNGEIYNFKELALELNLQTRTSSDTEVILEAFEKWGPEFVSRLNGMFAIAIYQKSTDKLHLFRDRLGIKPLFYYLNQGQLAFASELKALNTLAYFKQNRLIESDSVTQFLHLGYIPAPRTIYKNTFKFPQGSYAVFDGEKLTFTSYWDARNKITSTTTTNFEQAKETLTELLTSSVKYRLIADVPYGTFLSGGIDSSLVTAVAQSISNQPLKTFSIGFAQEKFNELDYAQQVANYLHTEHTAFILTEKEALALVPDIFSYYDEPFADSSAIPSLLVSKMARNQVTMALTGDGGDELFQGYGMYNWAQRLNNPLIKNNRNLIKNILQRFGPRYQRAAQVFDFRSHDFLASHIFSQEQYLFSQHELEHLMVHKPVAFAPDLLSKAFSRNLSAKEKQAFFDLSYYLPDDLLVKMDRASMRFSLEARIPLLDYRLVEFALNLHPDLKNHRGIQKYLLKEVLYDYVPKNYFDRPKWGFSIPLNKWLKTELKYLADDYLNETLINEAGWVKYSGVKHLLKQYYQTNREYLYNRIWALICLHKWYVDVYKQNSG